MFSATGVSAPAGGLNGCQFGDGSDVAHLGPAFACNNKLIGAYALTATYMVDASAPTAERVLQQHDRQLLGPRLRGSRHAHLVDGRRRLRRLGDLYGVERGPVCGIAPGAHVIMYRVCLRAGLLRLRLGRGRPAGDPRRAST